MSICRLINEEIKKIKEFELDLQNLDPQKYDALINTLNSDIQTLNCCSSLQTFLSEEVLHNRLLSRSGKGLQKIENIFQNISSETQISKIVTSNLNEVSEKTVIYLGDLDFKEYSKIHANAKSLPNSLKIILGDLNAGSSNIESLEGIEYVSGEINCRECPNLVRVTIDIANRHRLFLNCPKLQYIELGDGSTVDLTNCGSLESAKVGIVKGDLAFDNCSILSNLLMFNASEKATFKDCPLLNIENIQPTISGHKIYVGNKVHIENSGLADSTDQELMDKFSIKSNQIRRKSLKL